MEFNGFLPSIDHFCHLILSGKAFWWFAFLPETCSRYQISSGKGRQWSFCQDLMRSFYSMWNLGEKNKRVDAGAVGLVHWDRDVQEAVSPPHLDKTLSKNEILKLLARDCLHSSTWMFLHLDILHLDISHLDVLQALASQLAAQSLCQLVAKVSRAPLQKEEKQNCKNSGKDKNTNVTTTEM